MSTLRAALAMPS